MVQGIKDAAKEPWLHQAIVLVSIVFTIIGASYIVAKDIASLGSVLIERISVIEARMDTLEDFMNQGQRFTLKDAMVLQEEIDQNKEHMQEHKQMGHPPDDYRRILDIRFNEILRRLSAIEDNQRKRFDGLTD